MEIEAQNAIYLGEETGGRGRQFKARFLVPGLVKYDYGVCLLTKENADKFIQGFTGCPVVINHQNVTDDNVKDVAVGDIFSVWFDNNDGYYWCNGIIRDKEAIKLINEGYSVSCQYLITEYSDNTKGALHNGNPYDKVIENGKPEHLAIVNNPRYEGAKIAVNAIMAENADKWITIHPNGEENKGRHLLLKDGESVEDAMHRNGWYKKRQAKETQKKDEKNQYLKKGDLETDKVYKLGNIYVKPFIDKDGDLAFYDKTGAWGEGSIPQKFLKSDLKNLERVEKYDKLTDKELKFLSEKSDFEKETKATKKDENRHQKVRDLEDKAYKEFKKTYDNYINGSVKISDFGKVKEQFNQKYKDAFDKLESDRFVSFEDLAKRENKQPDKEEKGTQKKEDKKDTYKKGSGAKITEKRFENLFVDSALENNQYRITKALSDKEHVVFDKKRGQIIFYKQGDLSDSKNYSAPKGTKGMLEEFRTSDYDELVAYLFDKGESYRFELNKASNAFVEEFKDTLYTVLAEGIYNRLGE